MAYADEVGGGLTVIEELPSRGKVDLTEVSLSTEAMREAVDEGLMVRSESGADEVTSWIDAAEKWNGVFDMVTNFMDDVVHYVSPPAYNFTALENASQFDVLIQQAIANTYNVDGQRVLAQGLEAEFGYDVYNDGFDAINGLPVSNQGSLTFLTTMVPLDQARYSYIQQVLINWITYIAINGPEIGTGGGGGSLTGYVTLNLSRSINNSSATSTTGWFRSSASSTAKYYYYSTPYSGGSVIPSDATINISNELLEELPSGFTDVVAIIMAGNSTQSANGYWYMELRFYPTGSLTVEQRENGDYYRWYYGKNAEYTGNSECYWLSVTANSGFSGVSSFVSYTYDNWTWTIDKREDYNVTYNHVNSIPLGTYVYGYFGDNISQGGTGGGGTSGPAYTPPVYYDYSTQYNGTTNNITNNTTITNNNSSGDSFDVDLSPITSRLDAMYQQINGLGKDINRLGERIIDWLSRLFGAISDNSVDVQQGQDELWEPVDLPDVDFTDTAGDLSEVFPFSLPSDAVTLFGVLTAEPVTPEFELTFPSYGNKVQGGTIEFDLSGFDSTMQAVRTFEVVAFSIGLLYFSIRLFGGGS